MLPLVVALVAAASVVSSTRVLDGVTSLQAPDRVVAVGDVHGEFVSLVAVLRQAGLIGENNEWTGGRAVLVQTGDLLDRGDDEPEILELLAALGTQAPLSGGRVVLLNGNHEVMNMLGMMHYVTQDGFADYAHYSSQLLNEDCSSSSSSSEQCAALHGVPVFAHGRLLAFRPGGPVSQMLAERPAVAMVNQTLFVHGGLLPQHAEMGLARVNELVARVLRGEYGVQLERLPFDAQQIIGPDGPLWTRRFSDSPGPAACAELDRTLKLVGAQRMVVGHTPQLGGIRPYCDNRVICIDTGMSAVYGGPAQALELASGQWRVVDATELRGRLRAEREHKRASGQQPGHDEL